MALRRAPRPAIAPALIACALALGCGGPACGGAGAPSPAASSFAADDAALRARLAEALRAKGPGYVPRTRHTLPDGAPRYTNRLLLETSPYLLQHAHNPVDWFPWGDEAFARARATGKPVFLSVGYSTCHWCHVMEEESFEDEEIARFINERFVPIKVDREERPDVDAVYMTAVLSFTGSGGWPMSVWLTPEREPFFAGTYFPPRDGVRGARHGLMSVMKELSSSYAADPEAVRRDAKTFAGRMKRLVTIDPAGDMPSATVVTAAVAAAARRFDPDSGGMRGSPKFPSSFPVRLLLRHARRAVGANAPGAASGSVNAPGAASGGTPGAGAPSASTPGGAASLAGPVSASMAIATLDHMANGGIHDQIGGGFHRYATDARWRVPHFEKMLYDNALLAVTYLEAGQASGEPRFFTTARGALDYLLREMRAPDGTFFAATDADSLAPSGKREEGWFFTWTPAEVRAALDGDAEAAALAYFDVTAAGQLDGRSVLAAPKPAADVARDLGWDAARLEAAVASARVELLSARSKRPPPLRDDKVLVAWNALVVSALARAAIVLGEPRYGDAAVKAAAALVREVRADRPLPHAITAGQPSGRGFLDDHAALALAALDVLELTGDPAWLRDAERLMDRVEKAFADRANGGYFLTPEDAEALILRDKPADDGPVPSGNTMAALAWLRLATATGDDRHRARAETTLRAFAAPLAARPGALEGMLCAVDFATDAPKEIAIVVPEGGSGAGALRSTARPLLDVLQRAFVPNMTLVVATEAELAGPLGAALPWTRDKLAKGGRATAYVCERGACKLPVTDPADLATALAEVKPY